jgi:hypothetical protein
LGAASRRGARSPSAVSAPRRRSPSTAPTPRPMGEPIPDQLGTAATPDGHRGCVSGRGGSVADPGQRPSRRPHCPPTAGATGTVARLGDAVSPERCPPGPALVTLPPLDTWLNSDLILVEAEFPGTESMAMGPVDTAARGGSDELSPSRREHRSQSTAASEVGLAVNRSLGTGWRIYASCRVAGGRDWARCGDPEETAPIANPGTPVDNSHRRMGCGAICTRASRRPDPRSSG